MTPVERVAGIIVGLLWSLLSVYLMRTRPSRVPGSANRFFVSPRASAVNSTALTAVSVWIAATHGPGTWTGLGFAGAAGVCGLMAMRAVVQAWVTWSMGREERAEARRLRAELHDKGVSK